jgi:hypothetical protein
MPEPDLPRVLRALINAAAAFEKVAAKHQRIQAERKALQEAITDAQLVLSVQQRKPLAEVRRLQPREKSESSEPIDSEKARSKPKDKPRRP